MASPLGLAPWRRRAASVDSDDGFIEASGRTISPPPAGGRLSGDDARHLSSTPHREPIRSFVPGLSRDNLPPIDAAQFAQSVREDTAELASYLLDDSQPLLTRQRSRSSGIGADSVRSDAPSEARHGRQSPAQRGEATTGQDDARADPYLDNIEDGPSVLGNMLRRSPPESSSPDGLGGPGLKTTTRTTTPTQDTGTLASHPSPLVEDNDMASGALLVRVSSSLEAVPEEDETTPLLSQVGSKNGSASEGYGIRDDGELEAQKYASSKPFFGRVADTQRRVTGRMTHGAKVVLDPRTWDGREIWQTAIVAPVSTLPAVIVGLLLNILDALSYGMILFPLGNPIFADLGSAGISMFYVSTIIAQLTFSFGSIFKGGIGSELIEVVPFFHSMTQTIINKMGTENPDAVIATTIVSYSVSSMMTGAVFYLMGKFKFGYVVGFIPRHILIGCIGGVGFFLIVTGFEVSARMESGIEYDLDTLKRLASHDTLPLWLVPFGLAIILFASQSKITSKYFLPIYILTIPVIFYFFVFALDELQVPNLRSLGWIFEGPPAGEPWWYFYTLYKFRLVRWDAVAETIPAMLALTFFGILHVPINVPALALNTGEDHADLDKELRLHGYSNFLSGCAGSIQNYLVYANTVFFMRSGGDSRLAGVLLATLTFLVMMVGPSIIGFIPVMVVGTLIFVLGFELLLEAVWHPRKKLNKSEYLTVVVIVLIMGIYDFVVGIGVGILLAFVTLIFQTASVPAIRGKSSGESVTSTVRRNFSQRHYIQQVGRQICIIKLGGYLFFGTIVSVEDQIRSLIDDQAFTKRPIRYLILDLYHVTGLDYSAGEAFNTISRILNSKGVDLILSGVEPESKLGKSLRAVGVGEDSIEVLLLPSLNSALENCENLLLKTLYANQDRGSMDMQNGTSSVLDVPSSSGNGRTLGAAAGNHSLDIPHNSPRRSHLHEAAQRSLAHPENGRLSRWQNFRQPLPLLLQIFQGLSDKNEDFWFRAAPYFRRREHAAGTVLFRRGEAARQFFLVEKGILRADYYERLARLHESIVAGTTCGELPFFSGTPRTANVTVDRAPCVLWEMDRPAWERLQREDRDVATELLVMSLKFTSERMTSITAYTLTTAG